MHLWLGSSKTSTRVLGVDWEGCLERDEAQRFGGRSALMAHASSAVTARPPVQASPVARSLMTAFSTWPVAFRLSMYACKHEVWLEQHAIGCFPEPSAETCSLEVQSAGGTGDRAGGHSRPKTLCGGGGGGRRGTASSWGTRCCSLPLRAPLFVSLPSRLRVHNLLPSCLPLSDSLPIIGSISHEEYGFAIAIAKPVLLVRTSTNSNFKF